MFAQTLSSGLGRSSVLPASQRVQRNRPTVRLHAMTRQQVRCTASMSSKVVVPREMSKVEPTEDRVFVKVAPEEEVTEGGIVLPVEVRKKPTSGDVVSVGPSKEVTLKPGDTVLYSKFGIGCTDMVLNGKLLIIPRSRWLLCRLTARGKSWRRVSAGWWLCAGEDHLLIRERDCLGIFPTSNATADDVPKLKPLGNRVLIKLDVADESTTGGVLLPTAAKEKPITGAIVAVGPGKFEKDELKPCKCEVGDRVFFFKYAGQELQTRAGVQYKILHEEDVLGML
eukprot:scaffold624_cov402-Prasinococcus_capsulatus_cf.AAC.27